MMINLIIWSKDRACQLDLLLRSIELNANVFDVKVIYKASDLKYKEAYTKLFKEHTNVLSIPEKDFMGDTVNAVVPTSKLVSEHTAFSTDDMVFHSKCPNVFPLPSQENEVFSFRLGYNTLIQNCHTGETQTPLCYAETEDENILHWCPKDYPSLSNYAYPLALDTHVFKTSYLQKLLSQIGPFKNSNELESKMQSCVYDIDFMSSFTKSVAVNIPCNNMSTVTRAGESFSYSLEWLNDEFLSGKRISLEDIMSNIFLGCHQEVELKLV